MGLSSVAGESLSSRVLLLVAATELEAAAVLRHLPSHQPLSLPSGPARLAVCGVGPLNAALEAGRWLAGEPLRGVVNLGVAGSFGLALPLGSAAVVAEEFFPEFGLHGAGGFDPAGLGFAQALGPDGPVHDRLALSPEAAAAAMGLALPPLHRARSLTVAGVSGCPARAAELADRYPGGPLLENMEGFALALGCLRAGVPFLEVRSVSNRVGARPPQDWDLPAALDALALAAARLLAPAEIPC